MPKIPSRKEQEWSQPKTPLERERARLKVVYGEKETKPFVTWSGVVALFVATCIVGGFFLWMARSGSPGAILGVWITSGIGSTALFFCVLYLVIRAATRRD